MGSVRQVGGVSAALVAVATAACGGPASFMGSGSSGASSSGASAGAASGSSAGAASGSSAGAASGASSGATAGASSGALSGASTGAASGFTSGASGALGIALPNQVISRVDLLFDIDNSASMGDKQQYLVQAIPDLVDRLVNPNCLSTTDGTVTGKSMAGVCAVGSRAEFPAVKDMHLGIVSSSLGPRLSEPSPTGVCDPAGVPASPFNTISSHNDDRGHLITRSLTAGPPPAEAMVTDSLPAGFLYWYPTVNGMGTNGLPTGPAAPVGTPATLQTDFTALVNGVGTFGCGIESQMESWYRFLVQPDPYATLGLDMTRTVSGQHPAQWVGVDSTIIQERHDFLRPDSLVVVVVLSDENDSEIDARSLGGLGYFFMRTSFTPPHATSACATNPLSVGCRSCSPGSTDPGCTPFLSYSAPNDWGYDPNLRHVHMRQKYGLDPQYPVERYSLGLISPTAPDRNGEYPPGASDYAGFGTNMNCTNPLYAATLPTSAQLSAGVATAATAAHAKALCSLPAGQRTPDKVFFAHIGGVPHQLLHFTPGNPSASQLTAADWVKIVGTDPEHYNYNGIDPHMVESVLPRQSITNVTFDSSGTNPLGAPLGTSTADPVSGREWITDQPALGAMGGQHVLPVDLQFACTFPLTTPRDCTSAANSYSCDCPASPGLTHDQVPSVCSDASPTQQTHAKAYPTIRELEVAKLMGPQGIVSSICPVDVVDNASGNDPLYGYRPAVSAVVDRLKAALTNACLPHKLPVTAGGSAACTILVTLPGVGSCLNPTCPTGTGLTVPDKATLSAFCARQEANYLGQSGVPGDPALQSVCQLTQLTAAANPGDFDANGSCASSLVDKGWCYVEGAAASGCSQAIVFAPGAPPPGALTNLTCP